MGLDHFKYREFLLIVVWFMAFYQGIQKPIVHTEWIAFLRKNFLMISVHCFLTANKAISTDYFMTEKIWILGGYIPWVRYRVQKKMYYENICYIGYSH